MNVEGKREIENQHRANITILLQQKTANGC